jgi:hypothetical protein
MEIRLPMIYVAEIRILHWICDHTRRDQIRNDDIREKLDVVSLQEKMSQHRLR